jgi:hypothetical protein
MKGLPAVFNIPLLGLIALLLTACQSDTAKDVTSLVLTSTMQELDASYPQRFATITATARDSEGNLLRNATIEFSTSLGSFSDTSLVRNANATTSRGDANGVGEGQASVKLYPATDAGTANVTAFVNGYSQTLTVAITGTVVIPQPQAPASVAIAVSDRALMVAGVNGDDSALITIRLLQSNGETAQDAPAGVNNIRVSLISKTGGGEYISGQNAAEELVQNEDSLLINSRNGTASLTLNAGTLPGVAELQAEALKADGSSYSPAIITTLSAISIASGPAHSIAVSYPSQNAITDMGNGIYRRLGGLLVTDRYGNKVSDGTVVNLGVLDSVILSNTAPVINYGFASSIADGNATTSAGINTLSDPSNSLFTSANIIRNNSARYIEQSDRVLLLNAQAADKTRFVSTRPQQLSELVVTRPYTADATSLQYIVGAALLGAQVSGVDADKDELVSGQAVTVDGNATFYLTYPANRNTILTGCLDPLIDTRQQPLGSSQVWLIATVNNTDATTLNNQGCFSAMSDLQLINLSGTSNLSGSANITLQALDATDIELPFMPVNSSVSYSANTGGLTVSVGNCQDRADNRTNLVGQCNLPVQVNGGVSGDSAVLTLSIGESTSVLINVVIP